MPEAVPHLTVAVPPSLAPKPWWQSRTLWFNALVAVAAAAEAGFASLQPLLPVNVYQLLTFGLVLGNALLRVITTTGVTR